MTKKEKFEKCKKTFLEIRDLFLKNQEDFALAKALIKSLGNSTENTTKMSASRF